MATVIKWEGVEVATVQSANQTSSGDQGGKKVRRQERRGQETKEASRQGVLSRRRLVQGEANVWPRLLFFGAKSLRCFVCCIS